MKALALIALAAGALVASTAIAIQPASARHYDGSYGYGGSVEQYRAYCRDPWYRRRYAYYCDQFYNNDYDDDGYYDDRYGNNGYGYGGYGGPAFFFGFDNFGHHHHHGWGHHDDWGHHGGWDHHHDDWGHHGGGDHHHDGDWGHHGGGGEGHHEHHDH